MSNPKTLTIPYSRHFLEWLDQQQLSLGLTTYQTNRLCLIGIQPDGQIYTPVWEFDRPMALHATSDRLYLATRYQIWRLENVLEPGQLLQDKYDRLYVPRVAHTTGDLDIHAIAIDPNQNLIFANTEYSCLATLHPQHSFTPLWKPEFISKLAPEDRCHLNGIATVNGIPRYITAISQSDVASGWRHQRRDGGIVIDIQTNQIIAQGLSMPHSPRWHQNQLWLLNSGTGELGYIDNNQFIPVTFCPGYGRGLAFVGNYAIVGLSKPRDYHFSGLLLEEKLQQKQAAPRCGILIIDITSGDIIEWLDLDTEASELYDVAILPQVRCPMALGFKTGNISNLITIGQPINSTPPQTSPNSDPETLLFRGINWQNSQLTPAIALTSNLTKQPIIDPPQATFSAPSSPPKDTTYQQHFQQGQTLKKQGQLAAAETCFKKAILANPNYIPAHNNLGTLLQQQQRYNEAIICYQNTLKLNPNLPETLTNLSSIYLLQDQLKTAEAGLKRALEINLQCVPALYNLGLLYKQQAKLEAAIKLFQAAASHQPNYTEAYFQLAQIWEFQSQFTLAKLAYQRVQQLNPNYPAISHHVEFVKLNLCNWENYDRFIKNIIQSGAILAPFQLNALPIPPELSQKVAQKKAASISQAISQNLLKFNYQKTDKLRLGYISPEFYSHAVGRLIKDIFKHHNRGEFEVFGYHLLSAHDQVTDQIIKGCDEFRHLDSLSAAEAAQQINNDGIQILIDLAGYTGYNKPEILAYKPAPIQASFLGYPSTMGAEFIQYLITDNWVVPDSLSPFYTEEIIYLPHQFICSQMEIYDQPLNRPDFGLPETGFVFASFNRHYKISPDLFQVWMQLLQEVEGSVLWLSLPPVEETLSHLRQTARAAGVDPQRLIFAPKIPHNQYLARMELADLGLDTWNYNGGSTTIDALQGGLPVLTKPGFTNASRMGASICASAGVPEMICNNALDYQEKALYWATHPQELQQLRQQIKGRDSPLFDVCQFVSNLETALLKIWHR